MADPSQGELLNARFEIVDEIGRGGQAITYRAVDHDTGDHVALKELDMRRVSTWKSEELFQREAKTLKSLSHSAIPRYIDAFTVDEGDTIRLFIAQEFVDGETLADELRGGRRWDEASARADARQLLEALAYIHELSPPVVHRDVKPSNIIRRADGRLALVDFGAVQTVIPQTIGGSTIVGTPGYMAMEQLMGRAVPATDLYGLGATLVHVLSGIDPSALPVERNRMQFESKIRVGADLHTILRRLTEPSVEDRYASARDVLGDLDGVGIARSTPNLPAVRPPPGLTTTERSDGSTMIEFGARGRRYGELCVRIIDGPDHLSLETYRIRTVPRRRALAAVMGMVCAVAVAAVVGGGGLPPMALLTGVIAWVIASLVARGRRERDRDTRWRVGRDVARLEVDGTKLQLGGWRGATSSVQALDEIRVNAGTLEAVVDGVPIPFLRLSPDEPEVAVWVREYLSQRLVRAADREVVLDLETSDEGEVEFWKAEPAEVVQSP